MLELKSPPWQVSGGLVWFACLSYPAPFVSSGCKCAQFCSGHVVYPSHYFVLSMRCSCPCFAKPLSSSNHFYLVSSCPSFVFSLIFVFIVSLCRWSKQPSLSFAISFSYIYFSSSLPSYCFPQPSLSFAFFLSYIYLSRSVICQAIVFPTHCFAKFSSCPLIISFSCLSFSDLVKVPFCRATVLPVPVSHVRAFLSHSSASPTVLPSPRSAQLFRSVVFM